MIVLGIHDGHCSSACLMQDGKLLALAAEERFTRLKNDHGYPYHAIEFCLEQVSLKPEDLDEVAFATKDMSIFSVGLKAIATFDGKDWTRLHRDYWKPKLYEGIENTEVFEQLWRDERFKDLEHYYDFSSVDGSYASLTNSRLSRSIRIEGVKRHLAVPEEKIRFYDHHSCHAYYALFGSPIRQDNTMIYTLDGGGDSAVSTLFRFKDGVVQELARSNRVDIARIYRELTHIMGMKLGEHEFKVMGLAPYVTDREFKKSWSVFDGVFGVKDDLICYEEGRRPKDLYFHFKDAFEGHRFDGIAAAVQHMAETSVRRWFKTTQEKYSSRYAVFAGGVAMNVKLNMLLAEESYMDDFYVCPSPTDDTLCVGACYMAELQRDPGVWNRLEPISDPYLGPEFGRSVILQAIRDNNLGSECVVEEGVTDQRTAELLAQNMVVARCSGRMEFGQRAMGNRSILANPRTGDTVEKINTQIKYRDFWMPFAPVILAERANDYLESENPNIKRSYMMIGSRTTLQGRTELPAAIHRGDGTARPQVLQRNQNHGYYDIIKEFEKLTGTGALLNTSFNLHGEPIVCTPSDAISTFQRSELDVLLMDDIAIIRGQTSK